MVPAFDAVERSGRTVYSDAHHCISVAGSCIVTYSNQPPDARYFVAWNAAVARLEAQHSGLLSVVTIIDSSAPSPDEAARTLMRSAMNRYAQSIERFAYVVEGRGFIAAAIRSAISLVNMAARTPYRQKVFASVEEAGVWLARTSPQPGQGMDAKALSSLAHAMRDTVSGLARAV